MSHGYQYRAHLPARLVYGGKSQPIWRLCALTQCICLSSVVISCSPFPPPAFFAQGADEIGTLTYVFLSNSPYLVITKGDPLAQESLLTRSNNKSSSSPQVIVVTGELSSLGQFGIYGGLVFELFYRADLSAF